MSAQPDDTTAAPPNVVEIGGEKAVVVPMEEYRMLSALRDGASAADLEDALAIARHEADKAAGRVTGVTDDELDAYLDRLDTGEAR